MGNEIICTRCGSVNDYRTEQAGPHIKAVCNGCDSYLKMLPQQNEPELYFGKYKGRKLSSLVEKEELGWIQWAVRNCTNLKNSQVTQFTTHLKKFNLGI